MGALLSILGFVAKIGGALMSWWHDKGVRDAQQNKDFGQNAVAGQREVDAAGAARDRVDAAANSNPGGLRDGSDPDARPYDPNAIG